jgi:acyl carrier protein
MLESFPLTVNGKIDRAALPAPQRVAHVEPVRASVPLEVEIANIWRKALGIEAVGIDDNFFDVGGDSFLLARVHVRMQQELQLDIPITDLFEFTTIRGLARHLNASTARQTGLADARSRAQRQRAAFGRKRPFRIGDAS